jgi:hypothetical protein
MASYDSSGFSCFAAPIDGPSGRDERMRRVDLRLTLDADPLQNRHELLAEAAERVLGLPYVDNAEAVLAFAGDVRQKALDGPVSR